MNSDLHYLGWKKRVGIYGLAFLAGLIVAWIGVLCFIDFLALLPDVKLAYSLHPTILVGVFLFGLTLSIGTWYILTSDQLKQFQDSLQVRNDSLQVRNDTTFIESTRLLLEGKEMQSRVVGLVQLVVLKNSKAIPAEQVDRITGSKLKLGSDGEGQANLQRADFRDAILLNANLQGADLRGADLRGADLRGADLRGADLRGANLRGADLRGADLRGTDFLDAILQDAITRDLDLQDDDFPNVDLQCAKYDESTIFPKDYNPGSRRAGKMNKVNSKP